MNLVTCILTRNDCFKAGGTIVPKGVMIHSTGAANPMLRRYVQPVAGEENYETVLTKLGRNSYANHWNRGGVSKCVHAFIGRLADGSVSVVKTLPWNHRGWHAGTGTLGASANDSHIAFEICEDDLTDPEYFAAVYELAVALTASLCQLYDLDPMADGVVICHNEGYKRGIASGHSDVTHWFPRFGKSMDDFRREVKGYMAGIPADGEEKLQQCFDRLMEDYLTRLAQKEPAPWSEQARAWAEEQGLIRGDEQGNKAYAAFCTREQLAAILHRLEQTKT